VDYNALDYETMDGAGSDKDEDRFIKNGASGTVAKKLESEIAPTGNGAVEEDLVTTAVVKEEVQGWLLQLSVEHMFENALEPEEVLCF
jgi:hypothetical protein